MAALLSCHQNFLGRAVENQAWIAWFIFCLDVFHSDSLPCLLDKNLTICHELFHLVLSNFILIEFSLVKFAFICGKINLIGKTWIAEFDIRHIHLTYDNLWILEVHLNCRIIDLFTLKMSFGKGVPIGNIIVMEIKFSGHFAFKLLATCDIIDPNNLVVCN